MTEQRSEQPSRALDVEALAHEFIDRHRPEPGGCTCGFCVWSVEHVLMMFAQELNVRLDREKAKAALDWRRALAQSVLPRSNNLGGSMIPSGTLPPLQDANGKYLRRCEGIKNSFGRCKCYAVRYVNAIPYCETHARKAEAGK